MSADDAWNLKWLANQARTLDATHTERTAVRYLDTYVSRTDSRVLAGLRRGLYVQCIGEVDDVVTEAALLGERAANIFPSLSLATMWHAWDVRDGKWALARSRKKCTIERKWCTITMITWRVEWRSTCCLVDDKFSCSKIDTSIFYIFDEFDSFM